MLADQTSAGVRVGVWTHDRPLSWLLLRGIYKFKQEVEPYQVPLLRICVEDMEIKGQRCCRVRGSPSVISSPPWTLLQKESATVKQHSCKNWLGDCEDAEAAGMFAASRIQTELPLQPIRLCSAHQMSNSPDMKWRTDLCVCVSLPLLSSPLIEFQLTSVTREDREMRYDLPITKWQTGIEVPACGLVHLLSQQWACCTPTLPSVTELDCKWQACTDTACTPRRSSSLDNVGTDAAEVRL